MLKETDLRQECLHCRKPVNTTVDYKRSYKELLILCSILVITAITSIFFENLILCSILVITAITSIFFENLITTSVKSLSIFLYNSSSLILVIIVMIWQYKLCYAIIFILLFCECLIVASREKSRHANNFFKSPGINTNKFITKIFSVKFIIIYLLFKYKLIISCIDCMLYNEHTIYVLLFFITFNIIRSSLYLYISILHNKDIILSSATMEIFKNKSGIIEKIINFCVIIAGIYIEILYYHVTSLIVIISYYIYIISRVKITDQLVNL